VLGLACHCLQPKSPSITHNPKPWPQLPSEQPTQSTITLLQHSVSDSPHQDSNSGNLRKCIATQELRKSGAAFSCQPKVVTILCCLDSKTKSDWLIIQSAFTNCCSHVGEQLFGSSPGCGLVLGYSGAECSNSLVGK